MCIRAASLEALPDDEARQGLILRALANSLYSMEGVDEICLLSDGAELDRFGQVPVDLVRFRPAEEAPAAA